MLQFASGAGAGLWLSWTLLAQFNFLYPVWYDALNIEQTISEFGPKNRYRTQFELTERTERERLFTSLIAAIHHQGQGLTRIVYHAPDVRPIARLLTGPEIIHLRDVAKLIDTARPIGWISVGVWLALSVASVALNLPKPRRGGAAKRFAAAAGIAVCALIIIGPTTVFYQFHEWIFPADHRWFFYYQESLMTTLLKAPDIFAPITAVWIILALLINLLMMAVRHRWNNTRRPTDP